MNNNTVKEYTSIIYDVNIVICYYIHKFDRYFHRVNNNTILNISL
jgi:hypothetical protein